MRGRGKLAMAFVGAQVKGAQENSVKIKLTMEEDSLNNKLASNGRNEPINYSQNGTKNILRHN